MAPAPPSDLDASVLDLVFVVDCSGSMAGERMAALNWAARTVVPTLRAHAEDHPGVRLRLRVLAFATGAAFASARPEPIASVGWTNLVAGGESDMGAAFRLLADAVAAEAATVRPPVIVLFSDGHPSDDAEGGLAALLGTEAGGRAVRIPIAIGGDADMALLGRFASDPDLPVLHAHDVEMLVGRMGPAVAGPVAAALASRPVADESEDVW